jgi:hypothetical protein
VRRADGGEAKLKKCAITDVHLASRGAGRPSFFSVIVPLRKKRAQGRPGARCTRGLVCNVHKRKRTRAYRFSGNTPAFPAQWFTAYFVLSPVTGFLATVAPRSLAGLSASTGAPGPHDFAVRVEPRSSVVAIASTASHRAFVTLRNAPLIG